MREAIISVLRSMRRVFSEGLCFLFGTRIDHMSPIGRRILSSKTDRDNYLKSIEEANKTNKNVTFQLNTGEEIAVLPSR